ncbi:sigma-54-dependent Fis family transcriptional regulator [Candidatus Sumerlaeota bacterium]|nr:sigma-54-dependent Fis family transcriptional regulator [Candidatus Sumerlaeota bacterium]
MTTINDHPVKARILLVDDEKNLVLMLSKILRRHDYEVILAHDGLEGEQLLDANMPDASTPDDVALPTPIDLVMTDLQMPKLDGMTFLKRTREKYPDLPIIVLTGHGSIQSAVEAMKAGAVDYLIKPADPEEILIVLARTLEMESLRSENRQLKAQLGHVDDSLEIIGRSSAIQHVLETIRMVARNRSTVLITGESGTGKELVARAIHDSGPFARYPFVAVNCGALSETLLESQLFGHKRGAFTGAVSDHTGFFQAAEGGTLFLDEISEMSPHLQVKLLRAIQQREVIPVGDTQAHRINLRLVCATNRDLEYEVRERNFRQDLYYRLSVVNVALAPLRDRAVDIPDLIGHFILRFAKLYDVAPKTVQPQAMDVLLQYPWPGNIRELENVIERSFALSQKTTIGVEDLPPQLFRAPEDAMAAVRPRRMRESMETDLPLAPAPLLRIPVPRAPAEGASEPLPPTPLPYFTEPYVPKSPEKPLTLDETEKRQIVDALRKAKGRKVEAARILGIDRKRLYRKMKKYELE